MCIARWLGGEWAASVEEEWAKGEQVLVVVQVEIYSRGVTLAKRLSELSVPTLEYFPKQNFNTEASEEEFDLKHGDLKNSEAFDLRNSDVVPHHTICTLTEIASYEFVPGSQGASTDDGLCNWLRSLVTQ